MDWTTQVKDMQKAEAAYKRAKAAADAKEKAFKQAKEGLRVNIETWATEQGVAPCITIGAYEYRAYEKDGWSVTDQSKAKQLCAEAELWEALGAIKTTPLREALTAGSIEAPLAKRLNRLLVPAPVPALGKRKKGK